VWAVVINDGIVQVEGSRRNIEEHYDAGNAMYKLFLDPSLTYSSGIHRPGPPTDPDMLSMPLLTLCGCEICTRSHAFYHMDTTSRIFRNCRGKSHAELAWLQEAAWSCIVNGSTGLIEWVENGYWPCLQLQPGCILDFMECSKDSLRQRQAVQHE
jgi:hypothetical protein